MVGTARRARGDRQTTSARRGGHVTYASDADQLQDALLLLDDVQKGRQPQPVRRALGRARQQLELAIEYLRERARVQDRGEIGGPWYVHDEALIEWQRITRIGSVDRARESLIDACWDADGRGVRDTDRRGRQMYRTGKTLGSVRMAVDPRAGRRPGDKPALLWAGQSKPRESHWESKDRLEQVPSGRRERG